MFFSVKNLSSLSVTPVAEPWTLTKSIPAEIADKAAYRKWCLNPGTDHIFISGFEGVTASVRISKDAENAPYYMHSLVVDYDGHVDMAHFVEDIKKHPPTEYMPNWAAESFSGNLRLIWQFESRIALPPKPTVVNAFLGLLKKNVQLRKWFKGMDDKAYESPAQYYELGKNWTCINKDTRISTKLLEFWMFEACKSDSLSGTSSARIPLETVAAEMETRFPGRWHGSFEVGSRGIRFWDPSASDDTVCQVHPDGMIVYNADPKPFMTWRDIFGSKFVQEYEAEGISDLRKGAVYDVDNKCFWMKDDSGEWKSQSREDFTQHLKCSGFSSKTPKGATCSEIDKIENNLKQNNRVNGSGPFIFRAHGPIDYNRQKVMNTSKVKVLEPMPEGTVTGLIDADKYFPTIWNFLRVFFDEVEGDITQLDYFLAWFKHFYTNARKNRPLPGQLLFIAGPEGTGKTFLVEAIIGGACGGFFDGKSFVVDGKDWGYFCEYPVLKIDDNATISTNAKYQYYVGVLKKLTANTNVTYNTKFKKEISIEWSGRTVVLCNLDPESLRMIPHIELSNATKISFLKANTKKRFVFPSDRNELAATIARELPYFLSYLEFVYKIPANMLNQVDTRYYLMPYHHPDLYQEAVFAGPSQNLYEMLIDWINVYKIAHPDEKDWHGTVSELYRLMAVTDGMAQLLNKYDVQKLGRDLDTLVSKSIGIVKDWSNENSKMYRIPFELGALNKGEKK